MELRKEFKSTRYIKNEEVAIQYIVTRNSFEIYDTNTSGEKYYANGSLKLYLNSLSDFDGVSTLDDKVIQCLKDWDIDVSNFE